MDRLDRLHREVIDRLDTSLKMTGDTDRGIEQTERVTGATIRDYISMAVNMGLDAQEVEDLIVPRTNLAPERVRQLIDNYINYPDGIPLTRKKKGPKRKAGRKGCPVEYEGFAYDSIRDMMEILNMTYHQVQYRRKMGLVTYIEE